MINIAICEDNVIDQLILQKLVTTLFLDRKVKCQIECFPTGEALLEKYEAGKYDLVILDVHMGKINGIDTGRTIRGRDRDVELIYCTGSPEFALESYDVFAIGYLLKPYEKKKIDLLLGYFLERKPKFKNNYITVRSKYQERVLSFESIMYVESSDKVVKYNLDNNEEVTVYEKLVNVESELEDPRFMRCHQSYIVNLDYVEGVDDNDFLLPGEVRVPIRKREKKKIVDKYMEYVKMINKR